VANAVKVKRGGKYGYGYYGGYGAPTERPATDAPSQTEQVERS
jgi:hypothetical protein